MNQTELIKDINEGKLDSHFAPLLYNEKPATYSRYSELLQSHESEYGLKDDMALFSAPGRTEIGGNHTDHQQGRVLAGAVNLDIICAASKNDDNIIRIHSKGHALDTIDLTDLDKKKSEIGKSSSLIRGIAFRMKELGYTVKGFDAFTMSDVLAGSGLSSSAAFEILVSTVISGLYNDSKILPVELAKLSQFAEREYFSKPSGLLDQTACSVGGCVEIDFYDNDKPKINAINFDLDAHGYALVIVNTGANHADLTDDYGSVPRDMAKVAEFFGEKVLRYVNENAFFSDIKNVRESVGDKALLRAIHFFEENERVLHMANCVRSDDMHGFFSLVKASGKSSYERLQNVYSDHAPNEQSIPLALYLSEKVLGDSGAYRVHGGGFAGTIQAYVKREKLLEYKDTMERVFGADCCYVLNIRNVGGTRII